LEHNADDSSLFRNVIGKNPRKFDTFKTRLLIVGERRKTMDDQNVNSTVVTPAQGTTAPAATAPVEGKKHKKNKKAM
jgi:hypothetical protein